MDISLFSFSIASPVANVDLFFILEKDDLYADYLRSFWFTKMKAVLKGNITVTLPDKCGWQLAAVHSWN